MKNIALISTLFLDIGGVLLTDGWEHNSRKEAAGKFDLDLPDFEERHHQVFDTYEEGKLTLDEYLDHAVFYRKRAFTRAAFRRFMFEQSKPYPDMIRLVIRLKNRFGLKIAVVSNEARELNEYRIKKFGLDRLVDCFISSCFVHIRKPDADIFRLALDIAHTPARKVLYIDNTQMFIRIAQGLGIRGLLHTGYKPTLAKLASLGLT
jgi:putative hydrolase of the HAD superfamily